MTQKKQDCGAVLFLRSYGFRQVFLILLICHFNRYSTAYTVYKKTKFILALRRLGVKAESISFVILLSHSL